MVENGIVANYVSSTPRDVRLSHAAESKQSCALFVESHTPSFLSASCAMSSDSTAGRRYTVCLTICTCEATSAISNGCACHSSKLDDMTSRKLAEHGDLLSHISSLFHLLRISCHLPPPKLVAFVWRGDVLSAWSKRDTLSRASRVSNMRLNI